MAESTWGSDHMEGMAPKKKGVPAWMWACGIGCLGAVVLAALVSAWVYSTAREFVDQDVQRKELAKVLPYDELPEDYKVVGAKIPFTGLRFWIFDAGSGGAKAILVRFEEDAQRTRDEIFDPDQEPDEDLPFVSGGRLEAKRATVRVQGRDLVCIRWLTSEPEREAGADEGSESPFKRRRGVRRDPSVWDEFTDSSGGSAVAVDLSSADEKSLLVLFIASEDASEPVPDEWVVDFLEPFQIGPERAPPSAGSEEQGKEGAK